MNLLMDIKRFEKISKALGDANRLRILDDMASQGGALQCSQIVSLLGLAQPSVSHHIKTLIEADLIEPEKSGRSYTYQLNRKVLKEFIAKLSSMASCFICFC